MCHAMYDCAWMKCLSIKTHFFLNLFHSFFIFPRLNECEMQMPWLVLPMCYATIVPQYAIDRLLTTDLDINPLWMQTKHDASLDFLFLVQMLPDKDANVISMMQMSHAGMKMQSLFMMMPVHVFKHNADVSSQRWRCECLLMGMSWYKCPFVGMPWCKCSNPNTNYSKIPFIFEMRFP